MYFDQKTKTLYHGQEPFSLTALVKSNGSTSKLSEVTPKTFQDNEDVLLKWDANIRSQINASLKQTNSTFTVFGAAWEMNQQKWYYQVHQKRRFFLWVSEEQILKAHNQTKIANVEPLLRWQPPRRKKEAAFAHSQVPLTGEDTWAAGQCDIELSFRLKRRQQK